MADRSHRHLLAPETPHVFSDSESQTVIGRLLGVGSRLVAVIAVPKVPEIETTMGRGEVSEESIKHGKKEPVRLTLRNDMYLEARFRR